MAKLRTFDTWLQEQLTDPAEAVAYLNEHLKDDGEGDYEAMLLVALGNIARAHGMETIAEKANLNRETLYRTLSRAGNPRLATLTSILDVLGLELQVSQKASKKKSAKKVSPKKSPAKKKTKGIPKKKTRKAS